MILSMNSQIQLFLLTVSIGGTVGFLYDIVKTLRKIFPHRNFLVQVEDCVFWITVSTAVFYIMLNKNSGQIRGFCIGGILFGMTIYSLLLSKFVVKVSVSAVNIFVKLFVGILAITFYPIKIIFRLLSLPLGAVYNFSAPYILNLTRGTKKYLYITNRYAKIKSRRLKNNLRIIFKKI